MDYYVGAVADLISGNTPKTFQEEKIKHSGDDKELQSEDISTPSNCMGMNDDEIKLNHNGACVINKRKKHKMKKRKHSGDDKELPSENISTPSNHMGMDDNEIKLNDNNACESNKRKKHKVKKRKHSGDDKELQSENISTPSNNMEMNDEIKLNHNNACVSNKRKKHKVKKRKHSGDDKELPSENISTPSNHMGMNDNEIKLNDNDACESNKREKHKVKKRKQSGDDNDLQSENISTTGSNKGMNDVDEIKLNASHASESNQRKKHKIKKRKESISSYEQEHNAEQPEGSTQHDAERESRTIFVGNLPLAVKKLKLKKFFAKYGVVEAVRFRSLPLADTREPKRVAAIKKNFHPNRSNINAYIRYEKKEDAEKALEANGLLFGENHHIRVDMATPGNRNESNNKKAIFLGNVPFGAEEEELRSIFKDCGDIDSVRIVRDYHTGVGKGFAFVNFKSEDAVEIALQLDGYLLQNQGLRITRVSYKKKGKHKIPNKSMKINKYRTVDSLKPDLKLDDNKKPLSKQKRKKKLMLLRKKEAIKTILTKKKPDVVIPNKTVSM